MKDLSLSYVWNRLVLKSRGKAVRNSIIQKSAKIESGSQVINSHIGKYSFCGYDCKILNCDIGHFCSLADRVVIGGARHPFEWVSTSPVFYQGRDSIKKKFYENERPEELRTSIGSDVWIGEGVYVKSGVTIGVGAVIGMGSVVTKDVQPYAIVAGNPARLIRFRFIPEVITALLQSEWWNLSDEELQKYSKFITKPIEFIANLGNES